MPHRTNEDGLEGIERPVWFHGRKFSRREILAGAAGAAAATMFGRLAFAQQAPQEPWKAPGALTTARGQPSPYEILAKAPINTPSTSFTPLQDLNGIITPSGLHFERDHNGVPQIDPGKYRLLVHGMVEKPMIFTLNDLKRYPATSRIQFLECSGNSGTGFVKPLKDDTAQRVHGLTSTSEWVGVLVSTIFREVKANIHATWALCESMDAAMMDRSIPMEKMWNDAMLAYVQNGEAVRPQQGYPVRLLLPGFEGNANTKWIRRIKVADHPFETREETSTYTDPVCPPGEGACDARQFTFPMDAKSVITWPSGGQIVPSPGMWEIHGIAWSGRGAVQLVEVSTDGGDNWAPAKLEQPVLPYTHVRFRYLWNWSGKETLILSRCTDSTGYVQPTRQQLIDLRGLVSGPSLTFAYHSNFIQPWRIGTDGKVTNGLVS